MNPSDNSKLNEQLLERGLAFFGAVTASSTHELNNVIGIVDQTAGLLQDLLIGAKDGRSVPDEKLKTIADRIEVQTKRGVMIIKRLNSFAHTTDRAETEFELNDLVDNLVAIMQRIAGLKSVRLELSTCTKPIQLCGNPFEIEQALFVIFQYVFNFMSNDKKVSVVLSESDTEACIVVDCSLQEPEESFDSSFIEFLIARQGGSCEIHYDNKNMNVEMKLPRVC